MGSNTFGTLFKMTTWGESHGKVLGVVIDGCPAGLELDINFLYALLQERAPGFSSYTSPRIEADIPEIASGIENNLSTGAPIALLFYNQNVGKEAYQEMAKVFRPGHACYTYSQKYGYSSPTGGGRASARETVGRVAAGWIAQTILATYGVSVHASLIQIGNIAIENPESYIGNNSLREELFCPCPITRKKMESFIEEIHKQGDSVGGIVQFSALHVPPGWGDPVYEKIEALLAGAMLSIPGTKGFSIGKGFSLAYSLGSLSNDIPYKEGDKILFSTNHAGGIVAGISNGMPIYGQVAFKPTSSIRIAQKTLTKDTKEEVMCAFTSQSKHDPCIAIRGVPVVKAMLACVLADCCLKNRSTQLDLKKYAEPSCY